ncbi:MAG: hypothetical protein K8H86_10570 [Ignavibacteriaceae bacterium]|nr:hypothetical protein [Ignavibacteriaceae bacterium]
MTYHKVKIISSDRIAQDVYRLLIEKPEGYTFIPGQFTEVSIDQNNNKGHFSYTGLVKADNLEFILKPCGGRNTLVKEIIKLKPSNELIISEPQGNLKYKGMGAFIAGGIGITPFISIFRDLKEKNDLAGNNLIYSNKSINDVILHKELSEMLGMNYTNLFTKERFEKYYFGRIDRNFLRMEMVDFVKYFYVSGSNEFVVDIISFLKYFKVDDSSIIRELKE